MVNDSLTFSLDLGKGRQKRQMDLTYESLSSANDQPKRAWKAWKLDSTPATLENLSLDLDENVRLGVAWNDKTVERVLTSMTQDESERVREAARANLMARFTAGKKNENN